MSQVTPRLTTSKIAKLITTPVHPRGMSKYYTNHHDKHVTAKVYIPKELVTDEQLQEVAKKAGAYAWKHTKNIGTYGWSPAVLFYFHKEQPLSRK